MITEQSNERELFEAVFPRPKYLQWSETFCRYGYPLSQWLNDTDIERERIYNARFEAWRAARAPLLERIAQLEGAVNSERHARRSAEDDASRLRFPDRAGG